MSSEPPALSTLQPVTPLALDRIVETCLAKNPDDRWQHASDIKRQLEWILEGNERCRRPPCRAARIRTPGSLDPRCAHVGGCSFVGVEPVA